MIVKIFGTTPFEKHLHADNAILLLYDFKIIFIGHIATFFTYFCKWINLMILSADDAHNSVQCAALTFQFVFNQIQFVIKMIKRNDISEKSYLNEGIS